MIGFILGLIVGSVATFVFYEKIVIGIINTIDKFDDSDGPKPA